MGEIGLLMADAGRDLNKVLEKDERLFDELLQFREAK